MTTKLTKEDVETSKEQPDGIYTDGTYLLADFKNRIIIYDQLDMKELKTVTNQSDVKELQRMMRVACRFNTPDIEKLLSDLIIKFL